MNNALPTMKRNITKALLAILLLSLVAFGSYWTVYKDLEYKTCLKRTVQKLSIDPSYPALTMYIENMLPIGIARSDVHERLQQIAPIQIAQIDNDAGLLEKITLEICHHPFNNPAFYAYYTYGEQLTSIRFEPSP